MARMYPLRDDDDLARLSSLAESTLYRAFQKQLPDDVFVIHGLRTLALGRARRLLEGEADFIICDPRRGLLVVEAKSKGVDLDDDGTWYCVDGSEREKIRDPFEQARSQRHTVLAQLKKDPRWPTERLLHGHAVFFPEVVEPTRLVRPDGPAILIGCHDDVGALETWVARVFSEWAGDRPPPPPFPAFLDVVQDRLCAPIHVPRLVSAELDESEQIRIRLTDEQAGLLRALHLHRRAAIAGAAGTGKTLLAVRKAEELARGGQRTLLVCFNRGLADYLDAHCRDTPKLDAMSFHQLCRWRVKRAAQRSSVDLLDVARREYPGASEWDVQLPFALLKSLEHSDFRYDAIIVDEGQDFQPEYAAGIEGLLREGDEATFYVFFDPNQALYGRARPFPSMARPYMLTRNCRNTRAIHEAAYRFYAGEPVDPPSRLGTPITRLLSPTLASQAARIAEVVRTLVRTERVRPEAITVLWAGDDKHAVYNVLRAEAPPQAAHWSFETHRQPGGVVVDTVARYRGLEAPIVLLWGINNLERTALRTRAYVGLSRATDRLYLVGSERALANFAEARSE